ncbi:MAG: TMEM143 family protein [Gammaproteobacteria bacterium]|nr:TMEM143 family protein [Gammaproteobacteria bacterium]
MTDKQEKYRFIPYRRLDIVEMAVRDGRLAERERNFRQLCYMLEQIFHFEFHRRIEALKNAYAGIDPDTDTRRLEPAQGEVGASFVELLDGLLEKANYERVTEADLNQALHESSLFKIRLHVDFDDFAEVSLFTRGVSRRKEEIPTWFGLSSRTIEFINYDRVVVYIRVRDDFEQDGQDFAGCRAGATLLKLFRNVPGADLEMLFPNTRVRMRLLDKLLIGVPALVSGGIVLTTKLGASLVLLGSLFGYWLGVSSQPAELDRAGIMALLAGVAALGGYLWKQFNNFKNRKLRFMQALTQNLYFKNLDNNAGVFYRLADDAEEEESKEAILAYYFLLTADQPMTRGELDRAIELWFDERWDCRIDFEIEDALHKLVCLGLVEESDDRLAPVSPESGISLLDERWDNYFVAEK